MHKVFLDTNIVIDFLGERAPFYDAAAKLLSLADQKKIELFTSPTTIATTYYILSQYENSKAVVEKIKKFRVLCSISLVDNAVVDKAILSTFNDFEDAIQYYSALASQCDMMISRNEKDFKTAQIPVLNAMDFLKSLDING